MAPNSSFDDRRELLLSTAARVFALKGYHPTTMRDLSRATGMSLAGMYHYVQGKDELLYRVQERCFTEVLRGAKRALAAPPAPPASPAPRAPGEPIERLQRFITHHVTFFAEHMSEMKVLSHEALSLSEERNAGINTLKRQYVDLLITLIRETDGARAPDIDPTVAAYALFGMMNWIYTWYDPKGAVSPEALSAQFAQLFLHGLTESAPIPSPVTHGG